MKELTSRQYFQQLTILHLAMLSGMVMIYGIFFFVLKSEPVESSSQIWLYVIGGILLLDFGLFTSLFPKWLQRIKDEADFKKKMRRYFTLFTAKLALLEAPTLVSIIAYFLNGDKMYLMIGAALILVFALSYTNKDKVIQTLELGRDEIQSINNPDAIIAIVRSKY